MNLMNDLEEARLEIGAVDKKIASLFEERMRLAGRILDYKKGNGLPILDAAQEERVIANNISNIDDPAIQEYYVLFLRDMMKISKAYQARLMDGMKIAYCGSPGAFAHIAAHSVFPQADIVPYPDFESAYKACEAGEADTAILPVENSFAGDVGGVMDLCFGGTLYINLMLDMDVSQNLMGVPGARIEDIRTVISHPQALAQCRNWLRKNLPSAETIPVFSTATAAKIATITSTTTSSTKVKPLLPFSIEFLRVWPVCPIILSLFIRITSSGTMCSNVFSALPNDPCLRYLCYSSFTHYRSFSTPTPCQAGPDHASGDLLYLHILQQRLRMTSEIKSQ